MEKQELRDSVERLIRKAAETDKACDALQFSQAACNAANAMCSLEHAAKLANDAT